MPRRPSRPASSARLLALLNAFSRRSVLVVGDAIADEYVYGRVARVSREAPVLILEYDATEIVPGGAGNAAANVAALGASATLATIVGDDSAGRRLVARLPARVSRTSILQSRDYRTPVKTRILAGGLHSAKQQVVRIDRLGPDAPARQDQQRVEQAALDRVGSVDAILISDYGAGTVRPELVRELRRVVQRGHRPIPFVVDSRYGLARFPGLTVCTPNESEVEQLLQTQIDDRPERLEAAGRMLLSRLGMQAVLITRGSRGMALFEAGRATRMFPVHGPSASVDTTGAGDTVISTLALALAAGGSFAEAAELANIVAGLVVMKRGTATVSPDEVRAALDGSAETARR